MEKARLEQQLAFVEKHGWADADLFPLPSDASTRSYIRLVKPGASCLLMDAPAETEKLPEYLEICEHLQRLGLRSPVVYAADTTAGLALIEDFGDATFTKALAEGQSEEALYLQAVDVLVHMHRAGPRATAVNVPEYSMDVMLEEVGRFLLWFVPAARGRAATAAETQAFLDAWRMALSGVATDTSGFVFRDFHVDNLMIAAGVCSPQLSGEMCDKSAPPECGLLDFQDALKGPPAYDMASLLEDARRDITPATRATVLNHYFNACEDIARTGFLRDMALLAAQRHTKVAGLFVRLCVNDGKPVYLQHLPRVLSLLKKAMRTPELSEVSRVMEQMVPNFTEPAFVDEMLQRLLR